MFSASPSASLESPRQVVLVMLGRRSARHVEIWGTRTEVAEVVTLKSAAPLGLRRGRRSLGLGIDSVLVAVKALATHPRSAFVANNPWIGVALRLLGRKPAVVLGVYAEPGTRSWRILRRVLSDVPVVCTVSIEAEAWRAAGGTARHLVYGAEFDYPAAPPSPPGRLRIFVGGSSDRDRGLVERLETEIVESPAPVELVTAMGGPASRWQNAQGSSIEHLAALPQADFGRVMASADVVFLPLRAAARASGHMVAVGALQVGVPVVTTPAPGMTGYIDGEFVRTLDEGDDGLLLPRLREQAARFASRRDDVRAYWASTHALDVTSARLAATIAELVRQNAELVRQND